MKNRNINNFFVYGLVLLVVISLIGITCYLANRTKQYEQHEAELRFSNLAQENKRALVNRIQSYGQALVSGVGFFKGSDQVSRDEWKRFVEAQNITQNLPGINGIGYIEYVAPDKLQQFLTATRADGAPNFSIKPENHTKNYFVIKYIEPTTINQEAIGLNIAFEDNRYQAAAHARDEGLPTITKKIILVQDQTQSPGFLLLHPFYHSGSQTDTKAQRRQASKGWIYAPFIANNFFNQLTESQTSLLNVRIYDGNKANPLALLYDSKPNLDNYPSKHVISENITIMQQPWHIVWQSTPTFDAMVSSHDRTWIYVVGISISLGIGFYLLSLFRRTTYIKQKITEKTKEAKANAKQLQLLIKHTPAAVAMFDDQLRYLVTSERWIKDYHLENTDIIGKTHYEVFPDILNKSDWLDIHQRALTGEILECEEDPWERSDGSTEWIKWAIHPWYNAERNIGGIVMFTEVVTDRKQAELRRQQENEEIEGIARIIEDSVNEIFIIEQKTLNIIQANKGARRNSGYSLKELRQLSPADLMLEDDLSSFKHKIQRLLSREREKIIFQTTHKRKDGSTYDAEVHMQLANYRNTQALLQIVIDITETKNAEARTRLLRDIADLGTNTKTVNEAIHEILIKLTQYFSCEQGHAISTCNGNVYTLDMYRINNKRPTRKTSSSSGSDVAKTVLTTQKSIILDDNENHILAIPIFKEKKVTMVLEFFSEHNLHNSQTLLDFCDTLSIQVSRTLERKAVQQELERSNQLNDTILSSAGSMVIATDTDGKVILFNKAAELNLGYSADDIIQKETPAIWHDLDEVKARTDELNATYGLDLAPGFETFVYKARVYGSEASEWTYIRKNGSRFPVHLIVTPLMSSSNEITGFLGIAEDITDKKMQEDAIKASEKTFRYAIEYASIGMALVDPAMNWLKVNKALCQLLGYDMSELLNKSLSSLTHPDDQQADQDILDHILSNHKPNYQIEKRYIHKLGHTVWTLHSVALVRNADGSPRYFIIQVQDISEQKAMEKMKNEFISMVSHELRTPLTSIRGSLSLVTGMFEASLPEKALNLIKIAHGNCAKLILLINDILDMEKIASGNMRFDIQKENILEIAEAAIDENQSYADDLGVTIELNKHDDLANYFVLADKVRLNQVLTNLISNAAKFSPENSTITVNIMSDEQEIKVAITDQGQGIPKNLHNQLFTKFTQADSSAKRKHGGTGLGLYICKQIIEKLNGTIGFESEEGQGSTFWFTLPASTASIATITDKSSDSLPKILHLESDQDFTAYLQAALNNSAKVIATDSYQEALSLLSKQDLNLCLIEPACIPELTPGVLRSLKQHYPTIKIIILSNERYDAFDTSDVDMQIIKSTTSEDNLINIILNLL